MMNGNGHPSTIYERSSHGDSNGNDVEANSSPDYKVKLSSRFLLVSLFSVIVFAFGVGRTARDMLLNSGATGMIPTPNRRAKSRNHAGHSTDLPAPILIDGKEVPSTLYTAKNFDTSVGSASASVHLARDASKTTSSENECDMKDGTSYECKHCSRSSKSYDNTGPSASPANDDQNMLDDDDDDDDDFEEHLPAGQHLLIDIKNVDGTFLNSETRLAQAMIEVANESKLTLLSYHCHKLAPMGVSCVGVLLESHISFHTWPSEGVITLDLFTCGSGELVPVLPIVERLFSIPIENGEVGENQAFDAPHVVWTHKLRGFNPRMDNSPLAADLGEFVLENSSLDLKVEVGRTQTSFQRIDIYDSICAITANYLSYHKSLSNDGSYESLHSELYAPEREIYLDGVLQSTMKGNEAYHEALVQPAMFAHPNPKRVGIIGGGEGATLREVLKHSTLDRVNMIEIDEEMVHFSRKHLPSWNTCQDIKGSTKWCGDDSRAGMFYEDALAWFLRRFSDDPSIRIDTEEYREEPFDVVIMDALDPQDDVPFAEVLYNDAGFFHTLYNSLTEDGILVLQLGEAPTNSSPAEAISKNSKRDFVMKQLSKQFHSSHVYVEGNCGFRGPWSFVVAFKDEVSEKLWRRNAAEIDIDIQKRTLKTVSGEQPLKYFDGATMVSQYQHPAKVFQSVHCRSNPTPQSCIKGLNNDDSLNRHDIFVNRHLHKLKVQYEDKFNETICHVVSQARTLVAVPFVGLPATMCPY